MSYVNQPQHASRTTALLTRQAKHRDRWVTAIIVGGFVLAAVGISLGRRAPADTPLQPRLMGYIVITATPAPTAATEPTVEVPTATPEPAPVVQTVLVEVPVVQSVEVHDAPPEPTADAPPEDWHAPMSGDGCASWHPPLALPAGCSPQPTQAPEPTGTPLPTPLYGETLTDYFARTGITPETSR
jgi:hypothetical protein